MTGQESSTEDVSPIFNFSHYSSPIAMTMANSSDGSVSNHTPQREARPVEKQPKGGYKITSCPHKDQKYYAKGMCIHCYHSKGRTKPASDCPHGDRPSYAKNMCINCYQSQQRKARRVVLKQQKLKQQH